jgi:hypothetical protein
VHPVPCTLSASAEFIPQGETPKTLNLKNLEINYSGTGGELISRKRAGGKQFPYFNAVITKAVTKKEFSRLEKGGLN